MDPTDVWHEAGLVLTAAQSVVDIITRAMTSKNMKRLEAVLPELRAPLEKIAADLKAAQRYGKSKP